MSVGTLRAHSRTKAGFGRGKCVVAAASDPIKSFCGSLGLLLFVNAISAYAFGTFRAVKQGGTTRKAHSSLRDGCA